MTRDRKDGGHYEQEYTDRAFLEAFESAALPVLTSSEVAESVGCSRDNARLRLEQLVEDGELYRKDVGARAVVYIRLPDGRISGYGRWKHSLWTDE